MGEISLNLFQAGLKGRVLGNLVRLAGPEAASKKGHKRKRYTAALWLNDDASDFRVHSFHPDAPDWPQLKDWVKRECGIRWEPKKRAAPQPSFAVRNQYFGESLSLCHNSRGKVTVEQFNLLINDLRPKDAATRAGQAEYYAMLFGHAKALEQALKARHRTYTADERARATPKDAGERDNRTPPSPYTWDSNQFWDSTYL